MDDFTLTPAGKHMPITPTLSIFVNELSEAGAGYVLHVLCGLPEDCVEHWEHMGPVVEQHRAQVEAMPDGNWTATIEANDDFYDQAGENPRLAIARVLVSLEMDKRKDKEFVLSLPLRKAFEFGLSRDSLSFSRLMLREDGADEEMKIDLLLGNTV